MTSATAGAARGGKILLMAEVLPNGSWEWTAWKAIRPGEFRYGTLPTQDAACAAAEQAAADMAAASNGPPAQMQLNAQPAYPSPLP